MSSAVSSKLPYEVSDLTSMAAEVRRMDRRSACLLYARGSGHSNSTGRRRSDKRG